MPKNSIRNTIQWILFFSSVALAISYWITSSGFFDLSPYYPTIIGLTLGLVVLAQAHIITYFKQSQYKTINFDDAITWSLAVVGGAILVTSLLQTMNFWNWIPLQISSFLFKINIGVGLIAVIIHFVSVLSVTKKGG